MVITNYCRSQCSHEKCGEGKEFDTEDCSLVYSIAFMLTVIRHWIYVSLRNIKYKKD